MCRIYRAIHAREVFMHYLMAIVLVLHGLLHIPGFLKAFGYRELPAIRSEISRTAGVFWLLSFLMMSFSAVLLLGQNAYWWVIAFCGLLCSQTLILRYWSDARYGSIVNVLVTIMVFSGYSGQAWEQRLSEERSMIQHTAKKARMIRMDNRRDLPPVIQRWWSVSGANRISPPSVIRLEQEILFRTDPEQEEWTEATALHYMSIPEPGFQWIMGAEMMPLVHLDGRDLYVAQQGLMEIRINNFPLQKASGHEIALSSLQRYLAELVWAPWIAGSHHISWEESDSTFARGVIRDSDLETEGSFYFSPDGNFEQFSAMRYRSETDEVQRWVVKAQKHEHFEELLLPSELTVTWESQEGSFTWLRIRIKDISLIY